MFSAITNWFWNILEYLHITSKSARIIFLGLDAAGKTTLMYMLKFGRAHQPHPTLYPTMEELSVGNITFQAHDLGGHKQARRVWQNYVPDADAVLFLVDAADHSRFAEAKVELDSLLAMEELQKIPFLVLGNKMDLPQHATDPELRQALGLTNLTTGKSHDKLPEGIRPMELFMCTVIGKQGLRDAFQWLSAMLK